MLTSKQGRLFISKLGILRCNNTGGDAWCVARCDDHRTAFGADHVYMVPCYGGGGDWVTEAAVEWLDKDAVEEIETAQYKQILAGDLTVEKSYPKEG